MANMSYCKFRNTLSDLRACYEDMGKCEDEDEEKARQRLIKLCCDIAENHGWEVGIEMEREDA